MPADFFVMHPEKVPMAAGNGAMYGNIQGIKNLMSHYDKDGDYVNPVNELEF